jgi:hypothetical protein
LTLDSFFQAHGLSFDVASHEAAFDFDCHGILLPKSLVEPQRTLPCFAAAGIAG